jgi:hypothetical protein
MHGAMSEQRIFRFAHNQARRLAADFCMTAPEGWIARISEPTRTLDQNADQWPYLEAFASQLQWPVNGEKCWITADDWKDILTAAFRQEKVRIAQGIDGGMVLLGQRTSKWGKAEFSEWLEFLHATAAMRGVVPVYKNERAA